MKRKFTLLAVCLTVGFGLFLGFNITDNSPTGSRTNSVELSSKTNPTPVYDNSVIKYQDDMDGANDTTALKSRGYHIFRANPIGSTAAWFQGNDAVFPAFNGPTTGYTAANYNAVTGANNIDTWLILPKVNTNAGDTLSFVSRAPAASTFPDSIRVMYSASGDSTPAGSWVELGRFKVNTAGTWEPRSYLAPAPGANARFAIRYAVVNGGPSGSNSDFIGIDAVTIHGPAGGGPTWPVPELLYYQMNNILAGTTPNHADPGAGTPTALLTGHTFGPGGMADSTIIGAGGTGANRLTTGYAPALTGSSWTIGMWLKDLPPQSALGTSPCYLFGDPGTNSFRCFWAGAGVGASDTAILLRNTGETDLRLPLPNGPAGTWYVHFVYNSADNTLKAYRNGVFVTQVSWTSPVMTGAGPLTIAGYSTSNFALWNNAKLDEFRLYNRALGETEIAETWNTTLPAVMTGLDPITSNIPDKYVLSQNYPNPFNPTTKINFSIPKAGFVSLKVYDMLGREVRTLVSEQLSAGEFTTQFDAANLTSGTYFYRIQTEEFVEVKKMVLLK